MEFEQKSRIKIIRLSPIDKVIQREQLAKEKSKRIANCKTYNRYDCPPIKDILNTKISYCDINGFLIYNKKYSRYCNILSPNLNENDLEMSQIIVMEMWKLYIINGVDTMHVHPYFYDESLIPSCVTKINLKDGFHKKLTNLHYRIKEIFIYAYNFIHLYLFDYLPPSVEYLNIYGLRASKHILLNISCYLNLLEISNIEHPKMIIAEYPYSDHFSLIINPIYYKYLFNILLQYRFLRIVPFKGNYAEYERYFKNNLNDV